MERQSFRTDDCMEDVIAKYSRLVYKLAVSQMGNRNDADDVFQEVFFRYLKKKPSFTSDEHRKAWLIRVTINTCKKIHASVWIKRTVPLEDTLVFETSEEQNLFVELQKIPPQYREVIHLFYYEDMSIEEICAALGKKPSAIKMRLVRARQMLKEILGEDYNV